MSSSKPIDIQQNHVIVEAGETVPSGYVGLLAKADGLYEKLPGEGGEERKLGGGSGGSTQLVSELPDNKSASGITTRFIANEAQVFGDVVRINDAGKAQIAKADIIANATALAMLISSTAAANETCNYLLIGFVRNDAWALSIGADIYLSLSGTSGNTLTQTSPFDADPPVLNTVVQLLGIAKSATSIYFNPQLVQVELKP